MCSNIRLLYIRQRLHHTYSGSTTRTVALSHIQWLYHMYSGSTTHTVGLPLATSSPIAYIIFKGHLYKDDCHPQETHKLWSLIQHTALTKTTSKGNRLVMLSTPPPFLMSLGALISVPLVLAPMGFNQPEAPFSHLPESGFRLR